MVYYNTKLIYYRIKCSSICIVVSQIIKLLDLIGDIFVAGLFGTSNPFIPSDFKTVNFSELLGSKSLSLLFLLCQRVFRQFLVQQILIILCIHFIDFAPTQGQLFTSQIDFRVTFTFDCFKIDNCSIHCCKSWIQISFRLIMIANYRWNK